MSQGSSNTPPTTSEGQRQPPSIVPSHPRLFPEDRYPVSPTAIYGPNFPVLEQSLFSTPAGPTQAETAFNTGAGDVTGVWTQQHPIPSGSTSLGGPAGGTVDTPSGSGSGAGGQPPTQDPSKPHACDHPGCNLSFAATCNLREHKKQVHGGARNYRCDECIEDLVLRPHNRPVEFKRKADLKRHQNASVCVLGERKHSAGR